MKQVYFIALLILPIFAKAQIINTVAGNGFAGYAGDGAPATSCNLYEPSYCTFDDSGNLYITDVRTHLIRKVNTMGIITTYAGSYMVSWGAGGYGGDGGPATAAKLNFPHGIAMDHSGNLFIADQQNFRIRKVNSSGIITTYAGTGVSGFSGDGGPATAARFQNIWGLAVDDTGNVYVTELNAERIRKISTSGIITTIAGNGTVGHTGDGGPATAATLYWPIDVATDRSGNIYIADELNNCIRKVNTAGIISTFAGNGIVGFTGDGGPATAAQFHWPAGVTVDKTMGPNAGYVYVSDQANHKVRLINTAGVINSIAGTGAPGYNGDGIVATFAQLYSPMGLAVDASSSIYIADAANNRIRSIKNGCVIYAIPGNTVCTGTPVTYSVATTPGCTSPTYQWRVNGVIVGAASSYTYTPSHGDSIRCTRICSGGLPESSNTIVMTVSGSFSPTVSISASHAGTICSGTSVTFTTSSTFAGLSPVFQWKVNGITVGAGSSYSYAPANGDSVRCILTSSLICATPLTVSSSTIIMSVIGSSTVPTVTINATPSTTVCSGTLVTFTATSSSGGTTPFYQWKVNGLNVGSGGYIYTYMPSSGDNVICDLYTSLPCITSGAVSSNTISVTTNSSTTPSISIAGPSHRHAGSTVTLTATVAGAGSSYIIKWKNYGVVFSTTTTPTTTYTKTTGIDVVTAEIMSTSPGCYDTTTSGIILIEPMDATGIALIEKSVAFLYPNPTTNHLTIKTEQNAFSSFTITNSMGQVLMQQAMNSEVTIADVKALPTGLYYVTLKGETGTKTMKFVKM
ncbi:MAG: repeat containing protein [Flavipsychrobacter sp.]|jgi:hypothetical protein|nr:repeat containing protein [Flavipsychrobacter sp.]